MGSMAQEQSRRNFLRGAGVVLAAVAAGSAAEGQTPRGKGQASSGGVVRRAPIQDASLSQEEINHPIYTNESGARVYDGGKINREVFRTGADGPNVGILDAPYGPSQRTGKVAFGASKKLAATTIQVPAPNPQS